MQGVSVSCYVSLLQATGNVADTHPTCAPERDFSRTSFVSTHPQGLDDLGVLLPQRRPRLESGDPMTIFGR